MIRAYLVLFCNQWCPMNTAWMLLCRYEGRAIIPLERVCSDFFQHLTEAKLARKVLAGEIALPIVRIERSQKASKGVHLTDLAAYIDAQREAALKELRQLSA